MVEDEIIEELFEEFDVAAKIVDRVQLREEIKMKNCLAQMQSFYNECKNFCPVPDFLEELRPEDRAKDKDKIKQFHANLDNYKTRKEIMENMVIQDPTAN